MLSIPIHVKLMQLFFLIEKNIVFDHLKVFIYLFING